MQIKTPKFWYNASLFSYFLLPIAMFYYFSSVMRKIFTKEIRIAKRTIIIGNLTVGGGGKTPATLALAKLLTAKKHKICVLSRGYLGREKGPYWVKKDDNADNVGDEAMLIAKEYPCLVSENKRAATKFLDDFAADMVLLDDGYQNPTFIKDYTILIVDNHFAFGNNLIFPAGPLRMPVKQGVGEADMVIIIKKNKEEKIHPQLSDILVVTKKKCFSAYPIIKKVSQKQKYLAFCGLAINEKFFISLANAGYDVAKKIDYYYYYKYAESDIVELIRLAKENNLRLITTAKDAVKIPDSYLTQIEILHYKLKISEEEELLNDIITKIF